MGENVVLYMSYMDWKFIDTQADLEFFRKSVCWDDSELREFCGTRQNEVFFPYDISRSGYHHLNLHVLYDVCSAPDEYLHIVLIECQHFSGMFLQSPYWSGRVDALKRVETHNREIRCARMIYRFLPENEVMQNQPFLCHFLAPSEY